MGGIMPNYQRDAAVKRLRRAAEDVISATRRRALQSESTLDRVAIYENRKSAFMRMQEAWRAFPECERDEHTPSPEEVIARCDAYDRQKEEQERIENAARETSRRS